MGLFDGFYPTAPTRPPNPSLDDFQSNLRFRNLATQLGNSNPGGLVNKRTIAAGPSFHPISEPLPNLTMQEDQRPKPEPQPTFRNAGVDPYALLKINQERDKLNAEIENNRNKNKIAEGNLDLKKDIANDPNVVQVKTAGGDVYLMDRKSGRIIDTGVAQGTETAADKAKRGIDLENTKEGNREKLEGVKQPNRIQSIDERGKFSLQNTHARGEEARLTKQTESPNASSNLPSQQLVAAKLRANEFIQRNPGLAQYVKIDPNTGMVNITPPSKGGMFSSGGPTQQQYQQILSTVYPEGAPHQSAFNQPQSASNMTFSNHPDTDTGGGIRVKLPDGRTGTWDLSKGPIPQGITIINQDETEEERRRRLAAANKNLTLSNVPQMTTGQGFGLPNFGR